MNIEYIESEDKIFVTNEKGKIEERKRTDTIKEKLSKENELESVTNEISVTSEKLKKLKNIRKNDMQLIKITMFLPVIIIPLGMLLEKCIGMDMSTTINTIFGPVSNIVIAAGIVGIPSIFLSDIIFPAMFMLRTPSKKEIKSNEKKLELLEPMKKELEKELDEIKNNEKLVSESYNASFKSACNNLSSNTKENEIELINYYCDNKNKLNKLYKKDLLQENLKKYELSNFEINYIVNLVENDIENDNTYIDSELEKTNKKGIFAKFKRTTKK